MNANGCRRKTITFDGACSRFVFIAHELHGQRERTDKKINAPRSLNYLQSRSYNRN